ncbi:MAG: FAD:protein FMN transferase [Acidimicrobiales bacterium]|jgi:thiamine biosynthesis lipoprotein
MNFEVWGMNGSLCVEHAEHESFARDRLWYWLDAVDAACNRFRSDSEISRLNDVHDVPMVVSETLARCLEAALTSAEVTGGLCDPTVLGSLLALGYDRDFDELGDTIVTVQAHQPSPGISAVSFEPQRRRVTLKAGCTLDLGASAKALVADLVADELAPRGGVVVEIGGDVALRGSGPSGPWVVGIADRLEIRGDEPRVSQHGGGIATSSLTARTWKSARATLNHVIDPRTGYCATGPYASATVSAASCVVANAFSTAALLWGEEAGYHIAQAGWSARLVRHDGRIDFVGGWPAERLSA